uniref:Ionotropic receptor 41a.5 n=1 Tax=Apolygus lucorum TaxID=248454 RepID=A0A7S5FGZ4_APOLU|nr:ionotropic receptor 41a.5 [Apolygus lucorum]
MRNFFLISFLLILTNLMQISCYEDIEHEELTSRLAEEIAEKYFSIDTQNTCITIVADLGVLQKFSAVNFSLVRISSNSPNDSCDTSMAEFIATSLREKCARYIVQIARPECFLPAWFEAIKNTIFERHNPKIIYLPVNDQENSSYGDALLATNETNISPNILVIENSEEEEEWPLKIYTNNFHQLVHEPERSPKIYLDDWHPSVGFRYGVNLFPDKMRNLQQKTLRLFTVPYVPYSNNDPIDGSEVRMVKEFCNVFNCKVEGVYDGMQWGEVYKENRTGIGQVGALYTENADIGVGANTYWLEYWPYIDFSDCYLGGAVVMIAPKPQVLGGWLTPFLPFPMDLWLLVMGVVIASAVGLYLLTNLTMKVSPSLAKKT